MPEPTTTTVTTRTTTVTTKEIPTSSPDGTKKY